MRSTQKQDKKNVDEQNNDSQQNFEPFTHLPNEIVLALKDFLPSVKNIACLASVNHRFYGLFQPEVEKIAAKEAAECAIHPAKKNVEKLKALLTACPQLLLHRVIVKNRHGMKMKGTVYQVALHEGDNELIDDVIKDAFKKLQDGEKTMEAQRQKWFPDSGLEAEERACANACEAIDNLFAAFKNATHPDDVTKSAESPYTITINHQGVKEALEAYREAIDALYKPTNKVIENGRDPIIRLLDRVMDRYEENYNQLGGFNSPRNNALMQMGFGYCQRPAPINFMQTFAQGSYYIAGKNEKLSRTFEYQNWAGHFILPLDSDPLNRLGYEYFGHYGVATCPVALNDEWWCLTRLFINQKQSLACNPALSNLGKGIVQ